MWASWCTILYIYNMSVGGVAVVCVGGGAGAWV